MSDSEASVRILVEPGGTAVILRTPVWRSARFGSVDEALAWSAWSYAAAVPVLYAGLAATGVKLVVDDATFGRLVVPILGVGFAVGVVRYWRSERPPEPVWLSWEESVLLDEAPHPPSHAVRDLGIAVACAALLLLVGFLVWDDGGYALRKGGLSGLALAAVFCLGLCVGVGFGLTSAWSRVVFHRDRMRLSGTRTPDRS